MKNCQKILFLMLLSLVIPTSVLSKNIKSEEINRDLEVIQVAAFKEGKNILNLNRRFSTYKTFLLKGDDFNRFFIVNIKKEDFNKLLKEVRKVYPTAFKATKKIKKFVQKRVYAEDVFISDLPVASVKKKEMPKREKTYTKPIVKKVTTPKIYKQKTTHNNRDLDSKTILQTRKKFF